MRYFAYVTLFLGLTALASCKSIDVPASAAPGTGSIRLNDSDASAIGRKIWQNECGGTVEGLTSWNSGEDFPSLGIGHFIWYVPGRPGPFQESFPALLSYFRERGVAVPTWLSEAKGCPWASRAEFLREQQSPRMKELRQLLSQTVSVQTGFIVRRLELSLPEMQRASRADQQAALRTNFDRMTSGRNGLYAMIDYVNFKGEGIKETERYKGQGWGLRDVLLEMRPASQAPNATTEFSEAAKRVLRRRVENSPADRGESRWLAGWINRCDTYKRGI